MSETMTFYNNSKQIKEEGDYLKNNLVKALSGNLLSVRRLSKAFTLVVLSSWNILPQSLIIQVSLC